MAASTLFDFPHPVNEVSARVVAAGVVGLCVLTLATQQPLLLFPLAYGFVARTLTGPTLSPWAQVVTRVITPRLPFPTKPVPGPPKRFAQAMGAVMSLGAVVVHYGFGLTGLAWLFVAMIAAAATLEAVFAFCLGCKIFAGLMQLGVVPESVCAECADVRLRRARLTS